MSRLEDIGAGFSFLTRIVPPRAYPDEVLGRTMVWFPLIGAVIGLILAMAAWFTSLSGAFWVSAWCAAGLNIYLTRFLHLDGFADVLDSLGSHLDNDRFWTIIKDSRIGAFGAAGLCMVLAGQIIFYHLAISNKAFGLFIFAPVLGRCAAVCLGFAARDLARPGLGRLFISGATAKTTALAVLQTLVLGLACVNLKTLLLSALLCALVVLALYRLAKTVQGVNGDFLGAAIVACELCHFVAFTVVN